MILYNCHYLSELPRMILYNCHYLWELPRMMLYNCHYLSEHQADDFTICPRSSDWTCVVHLSNQIYLSYVEIDISLFTNREHYYTTMFQQNYGCLLKRNDRQSCPTPAELSYTERSCLHQCDYPDI